ncbi:hypothetical protein [Corallococcus sp. AB030]|uniref:hypothetical protein n=1 Tax=Corallococcus sp. AB030 TaxID=2316716 RepID=UPI0011E5E9D8|nr:hypothetical protein [Corallococcus sp. AB030]
MSNLGSDGQTLSFRSFEKEAVYQLDDHHPRLLIGVNGKHLPKVDGDSSGFIDWETDHEGLPADLSWMYWCPIGTKKTKEKGFSAERRFGYYEATVTGSWQGSLRCYLWPAKLFDRVQLSEMIRDIASAFGRPVIWEQTSAPVRAYVTATPGGRIETRTLIESAKAELRAVEQLQHMRMLGVHEAFSDWGEENWIPGVDTPEVRLVALWALRRLQHLTSYRQWLDRACASHRAALQDYVGNKKKEAEHQDGLKNASDDLTQAGILSAKIRGVADRYSGIRAGFELVPSMQRDHRLRRLLSAFATATQEWITERQTQLSTLPPLKAPAIFELWGAVKLVESLRALGWSIGPPQFPCAAENWGRLSDDNCWWLGTKEDERIRLDFRPRPLRADTAAIPPLHERIDDAWDWSARRLPPDFLGLFSLEPRTPDYALRWWSEGGRASLAIGDASLADPEYQEEEKLNKTAKYRHEVAWRFSESRLVSCAPAGVFLLFPGPADRWPNAVHSWAAQRDCYLLCPTPAASLTDFTARVDSLLQSLRRSRL